MQRILLGVVLVLTCGCAAGSGFAPTRSADVLAAASWSPVGGPGPALCVDDQPEVDDDEGATPIGTALGIALYLPNRIFDILDMVRARVRVGLGWAFSVRATEYADLFLGSYFSVYAGIPGPRGGRIPNSPIWVETKSGVELSVADVTTEALLFGPGYGDTEFGLGFHLFLIGVDVGVDPLEIFDAVFGFFTIDFMDDDL